MDEHRDHRPLTATVSDTVRVNLVLELPEQRAPAGTALYVHFPYCVVKCTYCDFYSVPAAKSDGTREDVDGVLAALALEAQQRAPHAPRTVFLGGGTPSLPSARQIRGFLDRLDDATGFRASALEVTAECNPESLDEHKARALLDGGVTRLSIGVQSLRPKVLELFGRAHGADDGLRALAAARAAGATRLSADLIHSVPGLTPAEWREDLERVLAAANGLDHLSAYNLTFEEGTLLERLRQRGKLTPLDEDTELAMIDATEELTGRVGLERYEVSNFAQRGQECRHNLVYWANEPYVGIGPSAVSKQDDARFGNPKSIGAWRASVESGAPAATWCERPSPAVRLGETWWLGLRRAIGVDPSEAREAALLAPDDDTTERAPLATAERLVELGLLEQLGARYRLTPRGLPVADAVAREFLVT